MLITLSQTDPSLIEKLFSFIDKGGVFIYFILLCSLFALTIVLYQWLLLKRDRIIPAKLMSSMDNYLQKKDSTSADQFNEDRTANPSVLSRLCDVVLERHDSKDAEIHEAVQVSAREEIIKLQVGIPILEVIIAIAPLLGLIGTATGLFTVFEGVGAGEEKYEEMAQGISEALITTVSGLAVAVPAVIAHGYFNRKIERYSSRMEVVMDKFVSTYFVERNSK